MHARVSENFPKKGAFQGHLLIFCHIVDDAITARTRGSEARAAPLRQITAAVDGNFFAPKQRTRASTAARSKAARSSAARSTAVCARRRCARRRCCSARRRCARRRCARRRHAQRRRALLWHARRRHTHVRPLAFDRLVDGGALGAARARRWCARRRCARRQHARRRHARRRCARRRHAQRRRKLNGDARSTAARSSLDSGTAADGWSSSAASPSCFKSPSLLDAAVSTRHGGVE